MAMTRGIVRGSDGGETISIGGSGVRLLMVGADTEGRSSVEEMAIPAGFGGPPAHVHRVTSHAWYVTEGRLRLTVGGESHDLGPGGFAYAPAGVPHTFANPWTTDGVMVQFTTPGGFDSYLRDLAAAFPAGTTIDPAAIVEIMARHDTYPA